MRFERVREEKKDSKINKLIDDFIKTNYDRVEIINEDDFDMGFGVFMFDDLVHHCDVLEKKFISGIAHAGIHSIKKQLNRIEAKLNNSPMAQGEKEEQDELKA